MTTPAPHSLDRPYSAPWLLFRLVAHVHGPHPLGDELRDAVGPDGVRDPDRLTLVVLGIMRIAERAGCDVALARRLVRGLVREALAGRHAPAVVRQVVRACGEIADDCCGAAQRA